MSRIFAALKIAAESRLKNGLLGGKTLGVMELPDRRESPRAELNIDLTVYGRTATDSTFYEQGKAVRGNTSGGLLLLEIPVFEGQDLLLINNRLSKEQICRVMEFRALDAQTTEVSVVFPEPNPDFWNSCVHDERP